MKTYKLVNPSDPYTFKAESNEIACVIGIMTGQGWHGIADENEKTVLPILIGTQEDPKKYLPETPFSNETYRQIADACETILIGHPEDRAAFEGSGESWQAWHDARRTSYSDIGRAVREKGARIREWLKAEETDEKTEEVAA